jgi:two-component system NtrC family response regulator
MSLPIYPFSVSCRCSLFEKKNFARLAIFAPMKATILIIDDEAKLRSLLSRIIGLEGYTVLEAGDAGSGLQILEKEEVAVVISDVKLPDASGVELAKTIKDKYPAIEVIVLTAFGTISDGVRAIKNGAFDYLTKGDDNEKIIPLLYKAAEKAQLQMRIIQLEKKVAGKYSLDKILGQSATILEAKELARKVAETDTTVLLLGETGTGKEVFAQSIHAASPRRIRPFVAVNCSALGKDILESELFGHKAGAFTGAIRDKRGLLEEAHGGTIFLDEIGEMDIGLQAKLLRVLETSEFFKVGDSKPMKVNVRIIAATNRDLRRESGQGAFRLDLFYRLSVFQIHLPSLNERIDDIEVLAKYFTSMFAPKMNKPVPLIEDDFLSALRQHYWKGNTRELKNVIERAVILSGDSLSLSSLPFDFAADISPDIFDLAEVEKRQINKVLHHTKGNKTEASQLLNISLATLYRKLKEYDLE